MLPWLNLNRAILKRQVSRKADEDVIEVGRARLIQDISQLRTRQVQRVPELERLLPDINVENPEKEKLFLPSDFSTSARAQFKLDALATVEYSLREGRAYESLGRVRHAIQTLNANITAKGAAIHGTGRNTKAQNFLKTLDNDIKIARSAYQLDRDALLKLGLPPEDQALQPLLKEHLRGKDGKAQAAGQAKESDPWFWRVGRPSNLSEEDEKKWNVESECLGYRNSSPLIFGPVDRVRWFRLRALRDRAREERETLEEEFSRTCLSFHALSSRWKSLAEDTDPEKPGRRAYAEKQSTMYSELAERCFVARGTLGELLKQDLKKQEAKEAKEAARAQKIAASKEEQTEDLWETLGKQLFPTLKRLADNQV